MKHGIELNPGHIGLGHVAHMTTSTLAGRGFCRRLCIWQRMVSEIKKAPAVGFGKSLTVFNCHIHSVECSIEKSTAGWFVTRAVWESWIKNPSQFFNDHSSFGKGSRFQISVEIWLLNIHVMIFGEARLSIVETVGCQRSTQKDPSPIPGRLLKPPIGIKHGSRA